jgi:hypothetical protein
MLPSVASAPANSPSERLGSELVRPTGAGGAGAVVVAGVGGEARLAERLGAEIRGAVVLEVLGRGAGSCRRRGTLVWGGG